ncbi:MAG: pre-peptidase C-terminal domain-containing protein [Acidobacteria bacterium]|nr:pre-peptidase C-terminal domain-containing protein [Acidobacteriota bacterium]
MINRPSVHNATQRWFSKWILAVTALVLCGFTGVFAPDASTNTTSAVTPPAAKAAQDTKTNLDLARQALEQAQATEKASPSKKNGLATDAAQAVYSQALEARVTELVTRLAQLKIVIAQSEYSKSAPPVSASVLAEFNAIRAELDSLKPYYNFNTRASQPVPTSMVTETEPNGTSATATPLTITPTDPAAIVTLTISPAADQDFFSFSATAGSRVWAYVDTGSPPAQVGTSRDSQLRLFDTDGTTEIEFDDDDASGNGGDGVEESGLASCIAGRTILATGTYFLRVNAFSAAAIINPCTLYVVVTSTSIPEVESNNTSATATPLITAGEVVDVSTASIGVAADIDYYSIVCEAGDILSINADCDPENNGGTDLVVELRDPSDVLLFSADSSISSARAAEGFSYLIPTAGTYFVRVTHFSASSTGTYDLMVARASASGGGGGGECMPTTETYSYTGPVVAIPDNNAGGTTVTLNVSGFTGMIGDLNFRFDGTSCTPNIGDTNAGLDHSWVGDLIVQLTSPGGTTVTLIDRMGVPVTSSVGNSGNNFCQTVLDSDGGAPAIEDATSAENPFTGTYSPNNSLNAFDGEDPNGTWTLFVSDNAISDTGNIRAFSLDIMNDCEPMEMGCTNPNVTLLVADTTNSRIQVFDGTDWLAPLMTTGTSVGRVKNPKGVTQTSDGVNIYVADTGNNRIQKSTDSGATWALLPNTTVAPVGFKLPAGVAVQPDDPNIVYVADTGNNRVLASSDGGATWTLLAGTGSGPNQVRGPEGMVVDCEGHLWIADTLNNRIVAYEPAVNIVAAPVTPGSGIVVAGMGSALNQVRAPKAVTVDVLTGDLFVADTGNNRVTRYTNGPVCTAVALGDASLVAGTGSALGQVRGPAGVTVSGDAMVMDGRPTKVAASGVIHLVIGDTMNNRIQMHELSGPALVGGFTLVTGTLPGQTATIGSAVGQFRTPTGVR